jgi:crotonobetainyl-CoA:carnitine CoA-transferase CaiB-like acyl-CoA transferase
MGVTTGVLDGVKVLELAEFGFVPACGAILADWGAEVVKVERATGDPLRTVQAAGFVPDTGDFNHLWELYNRNKRGVSIDLRSDDGRAVFDRLVAWADVMITNFLPSARAKLRVEPDDVWAVNPRLIYAKGHGQGQQGPDADQGGFDAVSYWCRGGIAHMLSPAKGPLIMQRGAMGDGPGGAYLAGGVAAALYQRERTGEGAVVDVSLLAAATWTLAPDLTATSVLGEAPPTMDATRPLSNPLVGSYRTADGRWVMLNMLDDARHWAPSCRALGLAELIDDARFADTAARAKHREELHRLIRERIAVTALVDLRAALEAEDTIWSVIASPTEVLEDPQVLANGYLAAHPAHAQARLPGSPAQFDDRAHEVRRRAPAIGEHTDQVLTELGIESAEIARLRETGALA